MSSLWSVDSVHTSWTHVCFAASLNKVCKQEFVATNFTYVTEFGCLVWMDNNTHLDREGEGRRIQVVESHTVDL